MCVTKIILRVYVKTPEKEVHAGCCEKRQNPAELTFCLSLELVRTGNSSNTYGVFIHIYGGI